MSRLSRLGFLAPGALAAAVILVSTPANQVGAGQASEPAAEVGAPRVFEIARHVWRDADGEPLPFQSDDEIIDFLRTATPIEFEAIDTGRTKPRKVLLERDGVRKHAIFRYVHSEGGFAIKPSGESRRPSYDSYRHEVAAYRISRMLGFDFVPPVTLRELEGEPGAVQIWIENASMGRSGDDKAADESWRFQYYRMLVLDSLLYNFDRAGSNVLTGPGGRLWAIDQISGFQAIPKLWNRDGLRVCERRVRTPRSQVAEQLPVAAVGRCWRDRCPCGAR